MSIMLNLLFHIILWLANFVTISCLDYPKWPWDFKFSVVGPVSGYICVKLEEAVPVEYYWYDNHFCVKDNSNYKSIGMEWKNTGRFFKKFITSIKRYYPQVYLGPLKHIPRYLYAKIVNAFRR